MRPTVVVKRRRRGVAAHVLGSCDEREGRISASLQERERDRQRTCCAGVAALSSVVTVLGSVAAAASVMRRVIEAGRRGRAAAEVERSCEEHAAQGLSVGASRGDEDREQRTSALVVMRVMLLGVSSSAVVVVGAVVRAVERGLVIRVDDERRHRTLAPALGHAADVLRRVGNLGGDADDDGGLDLQDEARRRRCDGASGRWGLRVDGRGAGRVDHRHAGCLG